jgi:membrane protease YdiL (CAAX protease family)
METLLGTLSLVSPFLLGILLSNFAARDARLKIWAYGYLLLIYALVALGGLVLIGLAFLIPVMIASGQAPRAALEPLRGLDGAFLLAGPLLIAGAAAGSLALAPPVRRFAARLFPIQADAVMDVTALSMTLAALGLAGANLAISAPLLTGMSDAMAAQLSRNSWWSLATNLFTLLPPALLGVGLFVRRSPRETLERLGLTLRKPAQLLLVIPLALALLLMALLVTAVWLILDPRGYEQIGKLGNAVLGGLTASGWLAAFAIGGVAGISEETLFRGALQPKLGIVLPTLLFALLHSQYLLSPATALVLLLGFVLALVRRWTGSTLICVLTHFLYNFLMVALSLIQR